MNGILSETEQTTLYYREGSSDKVYQCSIEPAGELFVVNFAYGRRGSTLTTGTKTSAPVDYESAKRIFDKLIREKTGKGYTPGELSTPYQHTEKEQRTTGVHCQLLNPIDERTVESLVNDPAWCMQEKIDGRRVLVMKSGLVISGVNRKGLTIGLPLSIMKSAEAIRADFIIDGEAVGEYLHAFDLLVLDGVDIQSQPYRSRILGLMNLLAANQAPHIQIVETAYDQKDKQFLLKDLRRLEHEGVVFKRLDAPYTPGRPNSGGTQLKHKFYATLSAVVTKINKQRSVEVKLLNDDGWVPAGNVTIPANHKIPVVGAVVEIRYLYAFPESGCLFQPTYLGERNDVEPMDCTTQQLKFKPKDEDES